MKFLKSGGQKKISVTICSVVHTLIRVRKKVLVNEDTGGSGHRFPKSGGLFMCAQKNMLCKSTK